VLLIWVGAVFASVLRAYTGFGFALAAVPVFSLFLAPTDVVVLAAALSLVVGLMSVRQWWGVYSPREMLPLVLLACVGTALGAALLLTMSVAEFQFWAALAVLLACPAVILARPQAPLRNRALTCGSGLLSGLMNGALAIPGPPMIVYALLTEFDPRRSRALLTMFFTITSVAALFSYAVGGLMRWQHLQFALLALPALYLGDRLGNTLFLKYHGARYRQIAVLALALMGVAIMVRTF
jgi:uncharacterized membrane protein YfcA